LALILGPGAKYPAVVVSGSGGVVGATAEADTAAAEVLVMVATGP
jgi:hypothetical protein